MVKLSRDELEENLKERNFFGCKNIPQSVKTTPLGNCVKLLLFSLIKLFLIRPVLFIDTQAGIRNTYISVIYRIN